MGSAPGTLTFLFTDIQGSTALLNRLGAEDYAKVLAEHHRIVRKALSVHEGREVGTQGDGFFALFGSPGGCAAAAISIQRSLASTAWPAGETVRVRMGLHCGEAIETASGPVGLEVHRAARMTAVAHGSQIVVSETAAVLLRDSLPDRVSLIDLGQHRLKDLGRPEHIFQLIAEGLDASFPPLRSLDNPELEHNLPIELTSFIGREKELKDIHTLVEGSHLVTLTGPGGSGKTRLALQVAADLANGTGDGVWLVELAPLSAADQVVREIASVLGVREERSRPLFETIVESLQYRTTLLVFDNCEHVIDAVAKLAETIALQCPTVWVLATSREPLAVTGERIYRVPPLGLPQSRDADDDPEVLGSSEAVRLFIERAKEHHPQFRLDAANASTVASVCRHLDGIPLALELAAARMGSMPLQEVESRLGQRFRLLNSRSRTKTARQLTLEGAIAWSHDLLNATEQVVFASLSVFPASFDLPAAESVSTKASQIDEFEVLDLVRSLVDKSLLQTEQGPCGMRYRMLESIAQYASDRLSQTPDNAAARTKEVHALHYLGFIQEAAPYLNGCDQIEWMRKIEADYDNVRTALSFFIQSEDRGIEALRMVDALRDFWQRQSNGSPGEAHDLATIALAHPQAQPLTKERCRALLSLGVVDSGLGEFVAARASSEAGIAIARDSGDSALLAEHLCGLALVLYWLGENRRLKETAKEALEITNANGDLNLRALAHQRMGVAETMDDPAAARRQFADAIRLFERAGNGWGISTSRLIVGNLEMIIGDLDQARSNHDALLEEPFGSRQRVILLMNLGLINFLEGDVKAAGSAYRDCLQQIVREGAFAVAPGALLGLAMCSGASGSLRRSATLHGAADAITEAHGVPWQAPEAGPRERDLAALRQRMGEDVFEAAYSQGHEMNRRDAVTLGLESYEEEFGLTT